MRSCYYVCKYYCSQYFSPFQVAQQWSSNSSNYPSNNKAWVVYYSSSCSCIAVEVYLLWMGRVGQLGAKRIYDRPATSKLWMENKKSFVLHHSLPVPLVNCTKSKFNKYNKYMYDKSPGENLSITNITSL